MAKVTGLNNFQRRLRLWETQIKAELRADLAKSSSELVAVQRSLAPRDEGYLVEGIDNQPYETSDRIGQQVSASDFKSLWHEFGTEKMPARPFFYPPYRALRRRFRARITRAINRATRRAAQ